VECPAGLHHDGALVLVASLSSRLRAGVHPGGLCSCAGLGSAGAGGRRPAPPHPPTALAGTRARARARAADPSLNLGAPGPGTCTERPHSPVSHGPKKGAAAVGHWPGPESQTGPGAKYDPRQSTRPASAAAQGAHGPCGESKVERDCQLERRECHRGWHLGISVISQMTAWPRRRRGERTVTGLKEEFTARQSSDRT
jgi:hypothetical protein